MKKMNKSRTKNRNKKYEIVNYSFINNNMNHLKTYY